VQAAQSLTLTLEKRLLLLHSAVAAAHVTDDAGEAAAADADVQAAQSLALTLTKLLLLLMCKRRSR
jgi:hypothetical protein